MTEPQVLNLYFLRGLVAVVGLVLGMAGAVAYYTFSAQTPSAGSGSENNGSTLNTKLLNLPPNRWIKFHQPAKADWRRQQHAGIAYDSKRGTLLIFGSDTHGSNWDNSVHAFDPVTERWTDHYPPAPKETYRADEEGHAIAGKDRPLPWAMHTYDNIVYDPHLDAMVVTALPEHNPINKKVPKAKVHPTWIYDLKTHEWRILPNRGKPYPKFFAAASAYDSDRDVIVAYKWGIWELGPQRKEWTKAAGGANHQMHYTMDYDSKHKALVVFGDYRSTNAVSVYTPGAVAGAKGTWEKKLPGGDACPPGQTLPVAFDSDHGVFLLVPDNTRFIKDEKGRTQRLEPQSSSTFIYDLGTNRYTRLPDADLPPVKMNYMMVYEHFHNVFLLVTGDWRKPPIVWALRLDFGTLRETVDDALR